MRGEFMRAAKILTGRGNFQTLFEEFVRSAADTEEREGGDRGRDEEPGGGLDTAVLGSYVEGVGVDRSPAGLIPA